MTRALLKKCIHEARWLFAGCATAIFAFCWLRVWIISQLDTGRFKEILDLLPDEWQRFTPVDLGWLISYPGRISLAYDELVVVMCVFIWAISRGSDCVSGELGRGTMELLLAQPLGRLKVLLTQSSVTIVGVGLLACSAWLGTSVGIHTISVAQEVSPVWQLPFYLPGMGSQVPNPFGEAEISYTPLSEIVDAELFLPATANLFALGLMLAGFSTLMSSWDRYRWRTIGIVVGVIVVELMIKIAGMASESLNWMLYFSVFTAYEPELFVRVADLTPQLAWDLWLYDDQGRWVDYGPLWYDALLTLIGLASYALAAVIFCRRDLPAPL